jgi:hypothetical protein
MLKLSRSALLAWIAFSIQPGVAHAGLFDMLFGGSQSRQEAPSIYAQPPLDDSYLETRPFEKMRRQQTKRVATQPKEDHAAIKEAAKSTDIFHDKTLRPGDAVMTANGVRVFEGDRGSRHDGDDFVKLSESQKMSREIRVSLDAINAHRSQPSWQVGEAELPLQTGRSTAAPAPVQRTSTDKEGRTIRVVGP